MNQIERDQHISDFLATGGVISCYNSMNCLIGYKAINQPGEPEFCATGTGYEKLVKVYKLHGEPVSTISRGPNGYSVLNHRTGRRSGATPKLAGAKVIAKRYVHRYKVASNRRKLL